MADKKEAFRNENRQKRIKERENERSLFVDMFLHLPKKKKNSMNSMTNSS
jgi:hypothetical protein